LYGSENLLLWPRERTYREEVGQNEGVVTGIWRTLHIEELHNVLIFSNSKRARWAGNIPRTEEMRNA
jgi:hypothetical protein